MRGLERSGRYCWWIGNRENITTEGLAVNASKSGQRLRVGEVELEVSVVCEPCELMEVLRPGLLAALVGRRGMRCRVQTGGPVRQGDEIAGALAAEAVRGVGSQEAGTTN